MSDSALFKSLETYLSSLLLAHSLTRFITMPPTKNTPESLAKFSAATRAIHGDDGVQNHSAVAPPMHVSTTFRYSDDPDKLVFWGEHDVSGGVI